MRPTSKKVSIKPLFVAAGLFVLGIVLRQCSNQSMYDQRDQQNRFHARVAVETIEAELKVQPDGLSLEHLKTGVEIRLTKLGLTNPFFANREISVTVDTEPPKSEIPGDIRVISRADGRYTVIAYGDKHCPTVYDLTGE